MTEKSGGISIKVSVDDKELLAAFQRLRAYMRNTTPIMRSIGVGLSGNVQNRLTRGYFEPQWPALNPAYKAGKRNRRMMVESGMLRSSITSSPGNGFVYVGTNRIYAALQQFGGVIKPKSGKTLKFRMGSNGGWVSAKSVTIPARPWLTLEEEDKELMRDIIFSRLEKAGNR